MAQEPGVTGGVLGGSATAQTDTQEPPSDELQAIELLDEQTQKRIHQMMVWLAHGYTVRYIQLLALRAGWPGAPTPAAIIGLREQFDEEILELRNAEGDQTMKYGLSRREERIRRLGALAEKLEGELALDDPEGQMSLKHSREYRELIKDIREETAPRSTGVGLSVGVDGDDQWLLLLQRLTGPASPPTPPTAQESSETTDEIIVATDSHQET